MHENEILCSMALSRTLHFYPVIQHQLVKEIGSASAVYENRHHIKDLYPEISDKLAEVLKGMDEHIKRAEEEWMFATQKGITCICYHDENFPARLRECDDAPILLFYKGNADMNRSRVINMIGTRHCTEYGKDLCRHFVHDLKLLCPDVLVVSGLAYGIDIHSHRAALSNGLDTIGVLAHGLDQIYPRTHRNTAIEMIGQGGLLTEFMSKTNADKVNFVRRNRIVAGMADATIVIESADKGGALITAGIASDYNRDVFAFPGRINDAYSQGCNQLIRDNKAILIQNADDFMDAIGWVKKKEQQENIQIELFPDLCEEEQRIIEYLQQQERAHINNLSIAVNIPIHKISGFLFHLEMKGLVKLMSGGTYRLL